MKITLRRKIGNLLIYGFITRTQSVTGLISKIPNGLDQHYPLWDFDNSNLDEVMESLETAKNDFMLNNIYIMSDKEGSYRAFSLTPVDFRTLLGIIIFTKGTDFQFFNWTVKRGYATIRMTEKIGRRDNKIITCIGNATEKLDLNKIQFVDYSTDLDGRKIKI